MAKKEVIGYTAGVFDLFHIGHLNLLRNAKSMCDKLIVGVSVDACVSHKNKKTIIPFEERVEIVEACRYVDAVVAQDNLDKFEAWKKLKFDILFSGDDWRGVPRWVEYEKKLKEVGVKTVFFPYTKGTSSSILADVLAKELKSMKEGK